MTLTRKWTPGYIRTLPVMVVAATNDPGAMSNIPVLSELPERLLSQCGLVTLVLLAGIVWLSAQLAKTRAGWETDRAGMMKLYAEQNDAYEKIAISHAKLEGMIYGIRGQASANDDD